MPFLRRSLKHAAKPRALNGSHLAALNTGINILINDLVAQPFA